MQKEKRSKFAVKKVPCYSAIVFFTILIGMPVLNLVNSRIFITERSSVMLVAHRGGAGLAPENTLAAIDSGIARKANLLEIDIRQTLDGHIVVMHDKDIDRTTTGSGNIKDLTLAEIRALSAAKNWDGKYKDVKVPLLSEVLDRVMASNAQLIIEIKDPGLYPGMLDRLIKIVKAKRAEKKVLIFSFNLNAVINIKQRLKNVRTGVFILGYENLNEIAEKGIDFISPPFITLLYYPSIIGSIHKRNCKVLVWTVDQKFLMKYLLNRSVDGIITNQPDIFNSIFSGK